MKKLFVIFLCLLAVLAIVACKNDPESSEAASEENPYAEPKWEAGVVRVKPGEGAAYPEKQNDKFQFQLTLLHNAGESIEFVAKFSSNITKITVRQGGGDNTRYLDDVSISSFDKDENGYSIITIPGSSVTPTQNNGADALTFCTNLGITIRVPNETRNDAWVAIKNMKINGVDVDFSEWDIAEDYVTPYYNAPDKLDIKIVMENEV